MDNPEKLTTRETDNKRNWQQEKLTTQGIQDEEKQSKIITHNLYWGLMMYITIITVRY